MELIHIEQAIREGCTVYAFRTQSGQCLVRIEDEQKQLKGSGEHQHAITALQKADFDYAADGCPYSEVLDTSPTHQQTHSGVQADELDIWIGAGCIFHILGEGHLFVFVLSGHDQHTNYFSQTGRGPTLWEAQLAAFAAEPCPQGKR